MSKQPDPVAVVAPHEMTELPAPLQLATWSF
jgi:hypothetical protein